MSKKKIEFMPFKLLTMFDAAPVDIRKHEDLIGRIVRKWYSDQEREEAVREYSTIANISEGQVRADGIMMTFLNLLCWEKQKITYTIDDDFGMELLRTRNALNISRLIPNLKCNSFYLDFSESPKLAKLLQTTGIIATIEKSREYEGYQDWVIYMTYINKMGFATGTIGFVDSEYEITRDSFCRMTREFFTEKTIWKDPEILCLFMQHIITILSLNTEDIEVSEFTKANYKKPSPGAVPKTRFSEVYKMDVGKRAGEAIRRIKNIEISEAPYWVYDNQTIVDSLHVCDIIHPIWIAPTLAKDEKYVAFREAHQKPAFVGLPTKTAKEIEGEEEMKRKTTKIKTKGYLPLFWASVQPLEASKYTEEELTEAAEGYTGRFIAEIMKNQAFKSMSSLIGPKATRNWARTVALVHLWTYDKQVYKVSPALGELIANNLHSTKASCSVTNAWDSLPSKTFCLDLSTAPALTKLMPYTCVYVHVCFLENVWVIRAISFNDGEHSATTGGAYGTEEKMRAFYGDEEYERLQTDMDAEEKDNGDYIQEIITAVVNYISNENAVIEETKESLESYEGIEEGHVPQNVMSEIQEWILDPEGKADPSYFLPVNREDKSESKKTRKWGSFSKASYANNPIKVQIQ